MRVAFAKLLTWAQPRSNLVGVGVQIPFADLSLANINLRARAGREGDPSDAAFFVVNWQMGENVIMQLSETQSLKGHER